MPDRAPHRACLLTCILLGMAVAAGAQTPAASKVPDLSGTWLGRPFNSVSTSDPGGQKRGNEDDMGYTAAGRAKLMAAIPPTGPFGQPDKMTDPWVRYCEPNGPVRIWVHPARSMFVQLPDK